MAGLRTETGRFSDQAYIVKLLALQLLSGVSWGKPAIPAAGPNKLANIVKGSPRLHTTAEAATDLRNNRHEARRAPPCLTAQDPHPWWDPLAFSGMSRSATELEWNTPIKGR